MKITTREENIPRSSNIFRMTQRIWLISDINCWKLEIAFAEQSLRSYITADQPTSAYKWSFAGLERNEKCSEFNLPSEKWQVFGSQMWKWSEGSLQRALHPSWPSSNITGFKEDVSGREGTEAPPGEKRDSYLIQQCRNSPTGACLTRVSSLFSC